MQKVIKRLSFSEEICRNYGIGSAVILDKFAYWTAKAEIEQKNKSRKGTPFFSCTYDGLLAEFPFKGDVVSRGIKTLTDAGIVKQLGAENERNRNLYYYVDFELLSQMGLGGIKNLAKEDAEKDISISVKFSEEVEKAFLAYPVRCSVRNRPIKRTTADKVAISKLLNEGISADDVIAAINAYTSDCVNSGNYICDLAQFLSSYAIGYIYAKKQPLTAVDDAITPEAVQVQAPVAPQPQAPAPQYAPQPQYQRPQPMPQSQSRYQAPQTIDGCVDGFIALYPKKHKGYHGEGEMINFPRIDDATKYIVASELFEQYGIAEYPTACKVLKFIRARIEDDGIAINDFVSDYAKYKAEYEKSIPKIRMSIVVYACYYDTNLAEEIKKDYNNSTINPDLFQSRWGMTKDVYGREFGSKGLTPPVEIIGVDGNPLTQSEIDEYIRQREEEEKRNSGMYANY